MSGGDKYDTQYDEAAGLFPEEVREHFRQMGYDCNPRLYSPVAYPGELFRTYREMIEAHPELRDAEGCPYGMVEEQDN